jgi:ABC-2 type transport system ATP-binding protein
MIKVENLTKTYGNIVAIDNISFQVDRGEILGFLGPNGAGKTTTMRMITGYMPPNEGKVEVSGFDIADDPIAAKNEIGYLPEHPPLYDDMKVTDFLDFVAGLKGVEEDRADKIEESINKCGISDVKNRLIGNLSKGYRQRMGIAQAILNNPSVLVLDEPTIGLDPKQIIEIRELIKQLGSERTVILSTHILPEVMMTCSKVVIIHKGRIALETSLGELTQKLDGDNEIQVKLANYSGDVKAKLGAVQSVEQVDDLGGGEFVIKSKEKNNTSDEIAKIILDNNWGLKELRPKSNTLEDVFLNVISSEQNQ